MVRGIESFREWFREYEEQYTIIGGTACDLLMSDAGLDFRATKDIDLVLIIEVVDAAFGNRFWEYVTAAGYEHRNKSTGEPQFYRFMNPRSKDYPAMIELFTRKPDAIVLPEEAVLSPLPMEEDASSLSAILLDNDYYDFLRQGGVRVAGVTVLDAPYLIPFKAKAWLDLSNKKATGEQVDSRNIRKHKNDVFRLTELLDREMEPLPYLPDTIKSDMAEFLKNMKSEDVDLKQIGIRDTLDEYNKFFRQPMKMLAAAGVLREDGVIHNTIQFSVENMDVLEYIALRERNSFEFLCLYIEKTLKDSGLWDSFETFFELQTKESLQELKTRFSDFCIRYTPINTAVEANRIFIKVLNPIACKLHKKGVEKGHLSRAMITYDKIMYNQTNWRDDAVGKDKNVARGDFNPQPKTEQMYQYRISRAMKYLRKFNDDHREGLSEVLDRFSVGEKATHMHHIFPQNEFAEIADYIENLIALTSGQHLQKAHPNGNTQIIDKQYQYTCLIAKTESIRKNIMANKGEPVIYDFAAFMFVLDVGLRTDYFEALPSCDFNSVVTGIEFNY